SNGRTGDRSPSSLQLARRGEAIERPPRLELPEEVWDEVLERARVLEPARGHGVVARIPDQLLRDLARVVVGGIQAAGFHALVVDPSKSFAKLALNAFATGPFVCALTSC